MIGAPRSGERVLLVSTYDLGHQPFGLASPASWLAAAGFDVDCMDLSRSALDTQLVASAAVVAFYIPMHTATRLAVEVLREVRGINPAARICFFGLYGQANSARLTELGADAIISGEFEAALVRYVESVLPSRRPTSSGDGAADRLHTGSTDPVVLTSLERLQFRVPDRSHLPSLTQYAQLAIGDSGRVVGYTEATRGCRHMCRHCPVVPVYEGTLRVVQPSVVLADVDAQVAAGARHLTFGDPDFLNAPAHAVRVVNALHEQHPELTYDVTIKIEHLLKYGRLLHHLAATGCLFITSAVESIDDTVLRYLDKGHSCADFIEAVRVCRDADLTMNPTFVAFHPWLTRKTLLHTFALLDQLDLVESVAPIQLTTRLLVPRGTRLLDIPGFTRLVSDFDQERLVYRWSHRDPEIDVLQTTLEGAVAAGARAGTSRREIFDQMWSLAGGSPPPRTNRRLKEVPHFEEPWFCCSEPVDELVAGWSGDASHSLGPDSDAGPACLASQKVRSTLKLVK